MRKHRVLIGGAVGSILLLAGFLVLQSFAANLLLLPVQWLWVAMVPVFVALVAGKYIKGLKAGTDGIEVALPDERLRDLTEATPSNAEPQTSPGQWQDERAAQYERTHSLCLVHVYTPSKTKGQVFDAFVYVVRHQKGSARPVRAGFSDVQQVEFYFGASWGHHVFRVMNLGNNILGVRARAYGTFLASCRVTFTDEKRAPVILHRYIDCEMLEGKG